MNSRTSYFLLASLLCFPVAMTGKLQAQVNEPDPFIIVDEGPGAPDISTVEGPAGGERMNEPLSAQISQHILKLAEGERDKRLKFMSVVIDDVARLCEIAPEQQEQLQLAAKGAAERSMRDWHTQAERYFRTRLDGADSDAAKEMLEGMGSVNFGGNRSEEEGESLDLWKDTLRTVLSEDQIDRYEEVLEQRQLDRIEAFTLMSVTTLDSHLRFTPKQKAQINELIHFATTAYLDDVQRYWGDYFERGMLMSLANAAEESELRKILTEEQYDRLKEATANFDHFWDQKRRLKRAKEKAALRRAEQAEKGEETEKEVSPPEPAKPNVMTQ
ncbi:MAG: hypothetical protein P1U68_05240 [Verrucomicrobiales bacterium]|nr:hypothetical protein [Verrucomicrobiales bacterium]